MLAHRARLPQQRDPRQRGPTGGDKVVDEQHLLAVIDQGGVEFEPRLTIFERIVLPDGRYGQFARLAKGNEAKAQPRRECGAEDEAARLDPGDGGMDIPLIRKFACGYAQGVLAANPDATVVANMTGTTPAAWNDPGKGSELTLAQISQGADVVYAAAGGTGVGVLQTAADEDILSIGVDANQNYLHPGQVLTSMLKRVDNAVYEAFTMGEDLETGFNVMGIGNDGVGYALDEHNASLVSEDMLAAVDAAAAQISAGELMVHDYTSDESCPALTF